MSKISDQQNGRTDWLLAGVATLLALVPRAVAVPIFFMNTHAARDLYRTWGLVRFQELPLAGPELYFGGAVPGFFYYLLQAPAMLVYPHPYMAAAWIAILNSVAAGVAFLALRLIMSRAAAFAAAAAFAFFPLAFVEMLYTWNPSYLPFIGAMALLGLCRWLALSRPMGFVLMLSMALLGMQVHLSTYAILAAALITLLLMLARRAIARGAAGCRGVRFHHLLLSLVIVLPTVMPYLWKNSYLMFLDLDPAGQRLGDPGLKALAYNPWAFPTYRKAFVYQDDTRTPQQFVHFGRFYQWTEANQPGIARFARGFAPPASLCLYTPFAVVGIIVAILLALMPTCRARDWLLANSGMNVASARPVSVALLVWVATPLVVLLRMMGPDPGHPLGIPTRYVVVLYPAAMAFAGLGVATAVRLTADKLGVYTSRVVWALYIVGQVVHLLVIIAFIQFAYRSASVFNGLLAPNYGKPLFVGREVSDVLANRFGLTMNDFRTRLLTDSTYSDFAAEQYLEYLLFEGDGSHRPGVTGDLRFYLYDTSRNTEPPPLVSATGTVVDSADVRQFRILAIQPHEGAPVWPLAQLESPAAF